MALDKITGRVKVWVTDYTTTKGEVIKLMSTSIGNKTESGVWINYHLSLRFKKSLNAGTLENGEEIIIKDSWLSPSSSKDGKTIYIQLFVNNFERVAASPETKLDVSKLSEEDIKKLKSLGAI